MDCARWTELTKIVGSIATGCVDQPGVVLGHSARHFKPKLALPLPYSSPITVQLAFAEL